MSYLPALLFALTCTYVVLALSGRFLRRYLLSVQTGMNDLPLLGLARKTKLPGTAVVCGGR